ncbi:MAG TPA: metal-dependent hydrolase, partial [Sulfurimonas sp.]|nr:metal-dependent hydrolase [Sulfurimonas sp.]
MKLKYLNHYPMQTQTQVIKLIESGNLAKHLLQKYPKPHAMKNDKALFKYTMDIKNEYIKKSSP